MRPPDKEGQFGRAWKVRPPSGGPPDWQAHICQWFVDRPGAHPYWHHYLINVIHLRDIPGVKPASKHYPEAQYEFSIFSLDSDKKPDLEHAEAEAHHHWPLLTPPDCIVQVHGLDDQQAALLGEHAVHAICVHGQSPDQDYRQWWTVAVKNDVEHIVLGGHPQGHA